MVIRGPKREATWPSKTQITAPDYLRPCGVNGGTHASLITPIPAIDELNLHEASDMRSHSPTILTRTALLFAFPALIAALALAAQPQQDAEEPALTPAIVRAEMTEVYKRWGKARVEYDKETMDSILAPEFLVQLYHREISREKFLSDVSQVRPGGRLTRFDADIMTVRKAEEEWVVVITERLEIDVTTEAGEVQKVCSLWITRDGCRKEDGSWLVTSSEAIGHEYWEPGETPPIRDW